MQVTLLRLFCSTGAVWISKPPPTHTLKCNILKYNTSSDVALIAMQFIPRYGVIAIESKTTSVFFCSNDSFWTLKERPDLQ